MTMIGDWWSSSFDLPCTLKIEQTHDYFHAHVEWDGEIEIRPGDQVRVHGAPVKIAFGDRLIERRLATIHRANLLSRAWTRLLSSFQMQELYEVSFTPTRTL